jgi:hypothetical protein
MFGGMCVKLSICLCGTHEKLSCLLCGGENKP